MKLTKVDSSNIKAVGYQSKVLVIQFHKEDRVYLYYKVPQTTYMNFVKSTSKGAFFSKHIAGKFDYSELLVVP